MAEAIALNGDMDRRATMDTRSMDWTASPSGTVWRKRLHGVGAPESAQVTSVVRYEPDSRFPAHDHPEGEEILVLDGVFSDEHGDWPAGTHLLNPEGFRHAPFSKEGCLLFVKLRQYAGTDRPYRKTRVDDLDWQATGREGVEEKVLFDEPGWPDVTRLERWRPGARPGPLATAGGLELFVLEGALETEEGVLGEGAWLRLPDGEPLDAASPGGCVVYVKSGAVATLRSDVVLERHA
jgi:anti-sigma factor ChrR (cupin superfamily)